MSCTSISTRYAEGCGITIGALPSPCPSRQARLGELATYGVRIRSECGWGRGDALSTAGADSLPHSLAIIYKFLPTLACGRAGVRGNARFADRQFPVRAGEGAAISLRSPQALSAAPAGGLDSAGRQTPEHGGGQSRLKLWLTWLDTLFGSWAPKGLYTRALIIIIAPIVILQSILTFVFLDRHWQRCDGTPFGCHRARNRHAGRVLRLGQGQGARRARPPQRNRSRSPRPCRAFRARRGIADHEIEALFRSSGPALVGGDSRPHPQALLDRHGRIVGAYRDQDQA